MSARGRIVAAGLAIVMLAAQGAQTEALAQRRDGARNNNVNRQNFQANRFRKDVTVNRNVNISGNDVNRGPSWGGAAAGVAVGVAVGAAAASAARAPAYPPPPPYPYYPYAYPPPY